jgi:transcriptional accessory protein Tex/SPT6
VAYVVSLTIFISYKKYKKSKANEKIKTYTFFCAQNEAEETKPRLTDDTRKRRARLKMDRFACGGYLKITIDDDDLEMARFQFTHEMAHCHYVNINMDTRTKVMIEELKNWTPSQVSGS